MTDKRIQKLPEAGLDSFIDNAGAAVLLRTPRSSRRLLWLVFAFVVSALFWASWAELDEVTSGSGRVIPSSQLQVVQYLEGGILEEIFVREGEYVKKGQPLLRVDDTRFRSDFREQEQEEVYLKASALRYRAELASVRIQDNPKSTRDWRQYVQIVPPQDIFKNPLFESFPDLVTREQAQMDERLRNLRNQLSIIEREIDQRSQEKKELISSISHLKTSYRLGVEELSLTQPLADQGVVPRVELIKLEREVNRLKRDLDGARIQLPKVEAAFLGEIYKRRDIALQFRNDTRKQLGEAENRLAQLGESQVGLRDRVDRTTVVSPVEGIIKTVAVNTVGGVIQPGMDLVEIVPAEDNLLIEAEVLPKDIAFLRPGLETIVRFSAYDFSIYGGLKGKLEHIGADSSEDEKGNAYFLIRARTDQNYLIKGSNKLPIIPGMLATVDIVTGKKTVLEYILKPILKAQQSALRER
jgi:adhesin transport system membrane fusion protein